MRLLSIRLKEIPTHVTSFASGEASTGLVQVFYKPMAEGPVRVLPCTIKS
jgi:hypothetical protein